MQIRLGVVLLICAASRLGAQDGSYPTFTVSGRLQTQFYLFGNDNQSRTGSESNFFIRRARIQVNAKLRENVSLVIQPSFEGGRASGVRLRDAYIDIRATAAESKTSLTFRMGAEKKPFNRYELSSSNNLPTIERNAGRGLAPVGSNNLLEAAGYIMTDLGGAVILGHQIDKTRRFNLQVGAYNGAGESVNDVNASKSFGARATVDVAKKLGLGLAYFSHDGIVTRSPTVIDSAFRNKAIGLEAQWGQIGTEGLVVIADYSRAEALSAAKPTMSGLSLVGAYHVRTKQSKALFAIEPVLRLDLADPDVDAADNASTLITAGVNVYLTARSQLRLMFESQNAQATGVKTISGIRSAWTMNF
ncbi:MAG: porin [Gemmatimonadales bacterium]